MDEIEEIKKRFEKVKPVDKWDTPLEAAEYYDFLGHAKSDIQILLKRIEDLQSQIDDGWKKSIEKAVVKTVEANKRVEELEAILQDSKKLGDMWVTKLEREQRRPKLI